MRVHLPVLFMGTDEERHILHSTGKWAVELPKLHLAVRTVHDAQELTKFLLHKLSVGPFMLRLPSFLLNDVHSQQQSEGS